MDLLSGNAESLLWCVLLTFGAAAATLVLSTFCGVALAYHARANWRYGGALALMFFPFAIGSSVWAFAAASTFSRLGLQDEIVTTNTSGRACVFFVLCLARSVPLGAFFCATFLQRYTSEIRSYLQIHRLNLSFFFLTAVRKMPASMLTLLGLFGGAIISTDASLPLFVYRANPGTGPESVNLLLSRLFREIYANAGTEAVNRIAVAGFVVSLGLLLAALVGTLLGKRLLRLSLIALQIAFRARSGEGTTAVIFAWLALGFGLLPGIAAATALISIIPNVPLSFANLASGLYDFSEITFIGIGVSVFLVFTGLSLAIRLRYSQHDWLTLLERNDFVACTLLLPAFLPVFTIIALLGAASSHAMSGVAGVMAFAFCHILLQFSLFQFVSVTLVGALPERHVAWQRTLQMEYFFSLVTDGFKRHSATIISLIGLCTIQVFADGSISRWYSGLVRAPEETLHAAVFGRLSSIKSAILISTSVATIAAIACAALAITYTQSIISQRRHA